MDVSRGLLSRRREWRSSAALAVYALAAVGLIPAYLYVAPASRWDRVGLIVALCAIAVVAYLSGSLLRSGIVFDATTAAVVPALALAGPLPALVVYLAPTVLSCVVGGRRRLLSVGVLADIGSFGWQILAGAVALRALGGGVEVWPTVTPLLLGGVALEVTGFCSMPLLYGVLHQCRRPRAVVREALPALAPALVMAALAAVTTALLSPFGMLALAGYVAIVAVPQMALPFTTRPTPRDAGLPPNEARGYAIAIARAMGADARERRVVAAAADLLPVAPWGVLPDRERLKRWRSDEVADIAYAVLHATERYDGTGSPAGLEGHWIPRVSRILAVVAAWDQLRLTLTAEEALLDLAVRAGSEFDPEVVAAAEVLRDPLPAPETPRPRRIGVTLARLAAR